MIKEVFRRSWPKHGTANIISKIKKVVGGRQGKRKIKVSLTKVRLKDIYGDMDGLK